MIGDCGGVELVIQVISSHTTNSGVCERACGTLRSLCYKGNG